MAVRRWHGLLVAGSAILLAGAGAGGAQQQERPESDLVQPEVRQEAPPVMVAPADQSQEQQPGAGAPAAVDRSEEQLFISLRRAEEALQNDDQKAAMQEMMQAEEQLDDLAGEVADEEPWQRVNLALQDAMKALAEENPEYALTALQRVTGQAQQGDAHGD